MFSYLRKALTVFSVLFFIQPAVSKSLTFGEGSPFEILQQDAKRRADFVQKIQEQNATPQEKEALTALVNGELEADDVPSSIDAETLAWFYGSEDFLGLDAAGTAMVQKASKLSSSATDSDYADCLNRSVCVMVSQGSQRLYAFVGGQQILLDGGDWARVSTGKNYNTPNGVFSVDELAHADRVVRRKKGQGAALYWAMQLHGHIFVHGTSQNNYSRLGSRASAGCIRVKKSVAGTLNNLMRDFGGRQNGVLSDQSQVRVIVADSVPDHYLESY